MQGIKVIKVNYQDMGNWAWKQGRQPFLHYHIFGRVMGAVKQPLLVSILVSIFLCQTLNQSGFMFSS